MHVHDSTRPVSSTQERALTVEPTEETTVHRCITLPLQTTRTVPSSWIVSKPPHALPGVRYEDWALCGDGGALLMYSDRESQSTRYSGPNVALSRCSFAAERWVRASLAVFPRMQRTKVSSTT